MTKQDYEFSDKKDLIDRIWGFMLLSAFLGAGIAWYFSGEGVIAFVVLVIGIISSVVFYSSTEAMRFKTPEDYEKYKERQKQIQDSFAKAKQAQNSPTRNADAVLKCPKCGSTQLHSDKRGFSTGKAVVGTVATLGVGLVAGAVGKDKIIITCLHCDHKWQAGKAK